MPSIRARATSLSTLLSTRCAAAAQAGQGGGSQICLAPPPPCPSRSPSLTCHTTFGRSAGCPRRATEGEFLRRRGGHTTSPSNTMRHRIASRVRIHREMSSPTFVPLTIFRGLAGVAFLCFGELFWMHLSRIGLEGEGKVLGSIALVLGSTMAIGALCGAAGISVSRRWCFVCTYIPIHQQHLFHPVAPPSISNRDQGELLSRRAPHPCPCSL